MTNPFSPRSLTPTWVEATEILKGDTPGHDFHGNQWTTGAGSLAAKTADLAQRQGQMSRSERAAQHDEIANQHEKLAARHRAEAEKLKQPVETPELDRAIANLRAVREGRTPVGGGGSPITSVAGLKQALSGTGGDPIKTLSISLGALTSATSGSTLEKEALAAAGEAREKAVYSLVASAQHIEDVVDGNGQYGIKPQTVGEIAPQDRLALRGLARGLADQAREIMSSTSGLGIRPPYSLDTWADGFTHSLPDSLGITPDYDYDKLSTQQQKAIEDAVEYSWQIQQDWDVLPSVDVPTGATVPTLSGPPIAANHGGDTASIAVALGAPGAAAELGVDDFKTFWRQLADTNASQLQPSTLKTLRAISNDPNANPWH